MGKRTVEVPTYNCTYCGFEALNMNQIRSQTDKLRYICGDCWIKAMDAGLGYKPQVSKPIASEKKAEPKPSK